MPISLIVKGPIKSARRAAARHGLPLESCRKVGTGKFGDVQCYAACRPNTNRQVVQWFSDRGETKAGRGFTPGTLLYHGAFCTFRDERTAREAAQLSGKRRKRRR